VLSRDTRELSAALYNKQRLMFIQARSASLFVPIRSMQYLAVIDREEIIFVDGMRPRLVAISWQHFRYHDRDNLRMPVRYDCVVYQADVIPLQQRLPQAFFLALDTLERKRPVSETAATIVPLSGGPPKSPG